MYLVQTESNAFNMRRKHKPQRRCTGYCKAITCHRELKIKQELVVINHSIK